MRQLMAAADVKEDEKQTTEEDLQPAAADEFWDKRASERRCPS